MVGRAVQMDRQLERVFFEEMAFEQVQWQSALENCTIEDFANTLRRLLHQLPSLQLRQLDSLVCQGAKQFPSAVALLMGQLLQESAIETSRAFDSDSDVVNGGGRGAGAGAGAGGGAGVASDALSRVQWLVEWMSRSYGDASGSSSGKQQQQQQHQWIIAFVLALHALPLVPVALADDQLANLSRRVIGIRHALLAQLQLLTSRQEVDLASLARRFRGHSLQFQRKKEADRSLMELLDGFWRYAPLLAPSAVLCAARFHQLVSERQQTQPVPTDFWISEAAQLPLRYGRQLRTELFEPLVRYILVIAPTLAPKPRLDCPLALQMVLTEHTQASLEQIAAKLLTRVAALEKMMPLDSHSCHNCLLIQRTCTPVRGQSQQQDDLKSDDSVDNMTLETALTQLMDDIAVAPPVITRALFAVLHEMMRRVCQMASDKLKLRLVPMMVALLQSIETEDKQKALLVLDAVLGHEELLRWWHIQEDPMVWMSTIDSLVELFVFSEVNWFKWVVQVILDTFLTRTPLELRQSKKLLLEEVLPRHLALELYENESTVAPENDEFADGGASSPRHCSHVNGCM